MPRTAGRRNSRPQPTMMTHSDLYDRAYQRCYDSEYDRWLAAGHDAREAGRRAREMAERYAARVEAAGSAD